MAVEQSFITVPASLKRRWRPELAESVRRDMEYHAEWLARRLRRQAEEEYLLLVIAANI